MLIFAWLVQPVRLWSLLFLFWLGSGSWGVAQEAAEREIEDVTVLPAMQVKGVRMEELGVRFNGMIRIPGADTVTVAEVFPNTAASRAGLKPGELVEKIDGKTVSAWSMAFKPNKLQQRKWAELEAGKNLAVCALAMELEVRSCAIEITEWQLSTTRHRDLSRRRNFLRQIRT